jgi:hypothetical protein
MIIIRVNEQYYKTEFILDTSEKVLRNYPNAHMKYCFCVRWKWTKKAWAKTYRYVSFNEFDLITDFNP